MDTIENTGTTTAWKKILEEDQAHQARESRLMMKIIL